MAVSKRACTWEATDELLVVKGNKCKYVFSNPNQHLLTRIKIDGYQITGDIRCDYLILDHCHNEYFVELKGKDLPHAVEQLEASIQRLSAPSHIVKKKVIIASNRNPSNDTSVQGAKAVFKKKYGVELVPKNIQMKTTIK